MSMDPLACTQAEYSARLVDVGDGALLHVMSWRPKAPPPDSFTLVFVAGWVSAVEGWADLLRVLAARHTVHYLETREKSSAVLPDGLPASAFGIEQLASDIVTVWKAVVDQPERAVIVGSSLGATGILEALKHERLRARGAFLIGPNAAFRFPWWGPLLLWLPACLYSAVRPLILWYLRTFRVDAKREPEQMRRYEGTLAMANPMRIKRSAQAVRGYAVWPDIATIQAPVAVAHAPSDSLHDHHEIAQLIRALPRSTELECPSNKHMHSAALVREIDAFLGSLAAQAA